ncbi:MAG: metallophosphoesterase family protein [Desulfobacterales bacterium]
MKIGVISDTHMSEPSRKLSELTSRVFSDVTLILHAGDITRMGVLEAFSDKKVIAVSGNMDQHDDAGALPATRIATVEGYRIGLIHGWGSARGIEDRIFQSFSDVNAIVYGHTHTPANHWKDGVLMFNPGAFSGHRSVGILTIDEGISGEIITL